MKQVPSSGQTKVSSCSSAAAINVLDETVCFVTILYFEISASVAFVFLFCLVMSVVSFSQVFSRFCVYFYLYKI